MANTRIPSETSLVALTLKPGIGTHKESTQEYDNALLRCVGANPGQPLGLLGTTLEWPLDRVRSTRKRLKEQGLVYEKPGKDRRLTLLFLTSAGEERLREISEEPDQPLTAEKDPGPAEDPGPTNGAKATSPPLTVVVRGSDPGCVHHFEIDPPNGPTSKGRCKFCGEVRNGYLNYIPEVGWEESLRLPGARIRI